MVQGLRQFPLRWEQDSGEIALYEADAEEPAAEGERKQMLNMLRIEKQLLSLRSEIAAHAQARSETPTSERVLPLDNAVRMARNGASVDDLTRSCGLNVGEAQLIRTMHAHAANAEHASA